MEFYDNMSKKSDYTITKNKNKSYTKITFIADFKRFEL